jgi:hypothetical protein
VFRALCVCVCAASLGHCKPDDPVLQRIPLTPFVRTCAETGATCTCDTGFQLDGTVCRDQDECALGTHDCDAQARCVNLPGTFACACPVGYAGDGRTCAEIDECQSGAALCDPHARCVNTPGSYRCECAAGFTTDGLLCKDIDECAATPAPCRANEQCNNAPGTFSCSCDAPFFDDGSACRRHRAFVLDDGGSFQRFATMISDEIDVTPAPTGTAIPYLTWDGTLPTPAPDAVVWLQGINYYTSAPTVVADTLRAFVKNGGGLVRTEWAAWEIAADPSIGASYADDLMPVGQFDALYTYADTNNPVIWSVLDPAHPLTRGLPQSFAAKGGVAQVGLKPGSHVALELTVNFATGPKHVPGASYMSVGGGVVVHINHDLLYHESWDPGPASVRLTEPTIARLFKNAVLFAATRKGATP